MFVPWNCITDHIWRGLLPIFLAVILKHTVKWGFGELKSLNFLFCCFKWDINYLSNLQKKGFKVMCIGFFFCGDGLDVIFFFFFCFFFFFVRWLCLLNRGVSVSPTLKYWLISSNPSLKYWTYFSEDCWWHWTKSWICSSLPGWQIWCKYKFTPIAKMVNTVFATYLQQIRYLPSLL